MDRRVDIVLSLGRGQALAFVYFPERLTSGLFLGISIHEPDELPRRIVGEKGARPQCFGVAQIPLGACVEIELVAEVLEWGRSGIHSNCW